MQFFNLEFSYMEAKDASIFILNPFKKDGPEDAFRRLDSSRRCNSFRR